MSPDYVSEHDTLEVGERAAWWLRHQPRTLDRRYFLPTIRKVGH